MLLPLPKSRAEIERIQRERKRVAVENALRAPFWRGKLDGIDLAKLDDPEEWNKIPILDKDQLRALSPAEFDAQFNIAPREEIAEYWRSGGTTGQPLFYPRTYADMRYSFVSWGRSWPCIGVGKGDLAHMSFPIGIHPAGQVWARTAFDNEVGLNWVGPGAAVPSQIQLELIRSLRPTIWMGMSSYALHLANLAEAQGIDLAASTVRTVITSAEPLSPSKREKIGRMWGAKVFDVFGMSEAALMGAEDAANDGMRIWTDMFFIEVVDPDTGLVVPDGEPGAFVVTPLWTNHATPFLRWNSGDIVTYHAEGKHDGPFSVFPMIRHTHRTTGFFKIRGVNINHSEFEDMMFRNADINDFKAELVTSGSGLETLCLSVEIKRGADTAAAVERATAEVRAVFEVAPEVRVLEIGTLAGEFEKSVKALRFVDRRS